MSIQLSQGECVVREYNYTKTKNQAKSTEESLIVTNKRIIHRTESHGVGSKGITNSEMPIKNATYVDISYSMKSYFSFLILGIMLAVSGLITIFSGTIFPGVEDFVALGVLFLVVAVIAIAGFFVKKSYSCSCIISTENIVNPVFHLGAVSYNRFSGKAKSVKGKLLQITVNKDVAETMVEELGALITDINAGNTVVSDEE